MDALDIAIQQTAIEAPGGMKRLAQLMGMNHQTLINKCNPNTETHKLSVREALALMLQTGDLRILEVMAEELGQKIEPKQSRGVKDLMTAILIADAEHGDVGRTIQAALDDGRLTHREIATIRDEIGQAKHALDAVFGTVLDLQKDRARG